MYPSALPNVNINNPPSESFLSSKYLNADYLFEQLVKLFQFVFRKETLTDFNTIFVFLAIFFITLIGYCVVRVLEIRRKEQNHLEHEIKEYAEHQAEREQKLLESHEISQNPRWVKVLKLVISSNAGDWKLAIIEADSMLENLLRELGFKGETLGDRLKSADQDTFRGLSNAWEVHTIRNRIAHEGEAFLLSSHEVKRVVALYEQIFRQYGYI